MEIDETFYIPVLKWRQAEYQALFRLSTEAKKKIIPIIAVPPLEFDPEEKRFKKSVQEVVESFPARVIKKWEHGAAWIDFDESLRDQKMDDSTDVITYVFDQLRDTTSFAVPVCWLDSSQATKAALKQVIEQDQRGVALRVTLENVMAPDAQKEIDSILKVLNLDYSESDFFLELGQNFEPYDKFSQAIWNVLSNIPRLNKFRNFAIIGTSIPDSLSEIERPGKTIPRHEWLFYQELTKNAPNGFKKPIFGDYTIVNPSFVINLNMAVIKPAARVIYACKDGWIIEKGTAFRDDPDQMIGICSNIINSNEFDGEDFSYGDEQIYLCANNLRENMSNLKGWKEFGINHHIMRILDDLATVGAKT